MLSNIFIFFVQLGDAIGSITIAISIVLYLISQYKNDTHLISLANSTIISGFTLILIALIIHLGVVYA
ncbi:MAG: hypothetical protein ACP5UN_03075 [Candidatus Micrarchaeia archaeon]